MKIHLVACKMEQSMENLEIKGRTTKATAFFHA